MCNKKVNTNCKQCGKFYCKTISELPICKKCLNGSYLKKEESSLSEVDKVIPDSAKILDIIQTTSTTITYVDIDQKYQEGVGFFSKLEQVNRTYEVKEEFLFNR